ncbi:MAG: SEC-C domain-containing protein [Proteobacteria bacterium]|nr:hypothetical protein [Desulfobulbaceae bacterium]MBU4151321.1 SEC-C domain-containing protein [Pseudomonadota bacterium]MDP2105034.1 YchJ family metal-binding protein [Desulfobulbaceae bacterium]
MINNITICPCNSGVPYSLCCEPLLIGDRIAATAEVLMRSRYTAYVVGDVDYLFRSWHPSTRPVDIDAATIPEWQGLHIVRIVKGLEADNEGVVEFKATFLSQQNIFQLHEVSRFVKEEGHWFYVDGDIKSGGLLAERAGPKAGRNNPCPCGSGKKFKKCCGP